jgi:hypothetical protein
MAGGTRCARRCRGLYVLPLRAKQQVFQAGVRRAQLRCFIDLRYGIVGSQKQESLDGAFAVGGSEWQLKFIKLTQQKQVPQQLIVLARAALARPELGFDHYYRWERSCT